MAAPHPMPTLVLPPRYTADSVALWKAAMQAGWVVERLQDWRAPDSLQGQDVVLYSEPLFAAAVADALDLALLAPPFDWLVYLPEGYQNRQIRFTTLGEARQHPSQAFIKPADDKCFAADVYASGAELPPVDVLPDTVLVLLAEPVTWEVEFRCFVLEREVLTFSPYWRGGQLAQAEDGSWPAPDSEIAQALAFSATVLHDLAVQLPPAVVLDIGIIAGRGWSVVEANSAWGSGVYGCDPAQVLPVIHRACINRDQLTPADRVWTEPLMTIRA